MMKYMFREWVKTLGADEFGGRKPMTKYEDMTIGYLAAQMEAMGLEPAFDGSWYHKPCDEYRDDWDLAGTLANVNLIFSVAVSLSNANFSE